MLRLSMKRGRWRRAARERRKADREERAAAAATTTTTAAVGIGNGGPLASAAAGSGPAPLAAGRPFEWIEWLMRRELLGNTPCSTPDGPSGKKGT